MTRYADRDVVALGQLYVDHVGAMTSEGLHSKSDIAAELAWRDLRIHDLAKRLEEVTDVADALGDSVSRLSAKVSHREELLATAYQLAGLVGAPLRFLDAYSRHEGDVDSLLPVNLTELDEFKALQDKLDAIRRYIMGCEERDIVPWNYGNAIERCSGLENLFLTDFRETAK